MNRSILLAVDGTPAAGRALEFVYGYRGDRSGVHVVCANVQPRPVAAWPEAPMSMRAVEEALLARGREIADPLAARLRAAGFPADAAARLGFPADAIVREAQARGVQMIVMGTRGQGMLGGFALGSVALRVVHAASVPVFLVRPESRLPAQMGRKLRVMLAHDGSEPALHAASALASLRWWLGELDVQIVHVQPALTYLEMLLPPHDDALRQWSSAAGEHAARQARELFEKEGIASHLHLSAGDPALEIVQLAAETRCDLVFMGTRGLGAAHHAFIGSVALKVAAHAAMPVALVK